MKWLRYSMIVLLSMLVAVANASTGEKPPFTYDTIFVAPKKKADTGEKTQSRQKQAKPASKVRTSGNTRLRSTNGRTALNQDLRATSVDERNGHWSFDGNFGLGFGDYTTINLSPQIGYSPNSFFTFGVGINYNYYDDRDYDDSRHYFGGNLFMKLHPIPYITLQIQPEIQKSWRRVDGERVSGDIFPCLLVGAGGNLPVGPGRYFSLMFYYDLLQRHNTPYGSKIFYSVGYSFSF